MEIVSGSQNTQVPQVTALKHVAGLRVHFTFWDGTAAEMDLEPLLTGPIFEPLRRDPALFATMYLDGVRLRGRTARTLRRKLSTIWRAVFPTTRTLHKRLGVEQPPANTGGED